MSEKIKQAIIESVAKARTRSGLSADGEPLRCFIAVSGGEDSHVLLHSFRARTKDLNLELAVAHINPGESASFDKREKFVRQLAARYKLPLIVHKSPAKEPGMHNCTSHLQDRMRFFERACKSYGADFVAAGNHLEDRLEELLFELLPGHATGMERVAVSGKLLLPFLSLERSLLEDYSIQNNLAFLSHSDAHPNTPARLALRGTVWPLMINGSSAQISENLHRVERMLAAAFADESAAVVPQEVSNVPAVIEAIDESAGKRLKIPGMVVCQYDDGSRASIEASMTSAEERQARGVLNSLLEHNGNHLSIAKAYFDQNLLPGRTLSTREYVDTDAVLTAEGVTLAVAELFARAGIPEELRHRIPMVLSAGVIIWIPGVFAYSPATVTRDTETLIELSYRRRERRYGVGRGMQQAASSAKWASTGDSPLKQGRD